MPELIFKTLSLSNLKDLYLFYKKSLTKEQHRLFMPHPNFKPLCFFMYSLMSISQYFGKACYFLVYQNVSEKPVGFVFLRKIKKNNAELGVAIADSEQGKGYGKTLMKYIINQGRGRGLKEIYLTVDQGNIAASSLYKKMGFQKSGVIKKKLLNGELRNEDKQTLYLLK